MVYRIKQFIWGMTGKLSSDDRNLINTYLDENELQLFYKLPRNEQVHSVKVAREVIEECDRLGIKDSSLIKAAFLHDVGKIDSGLNIFSKSIIVILNRFAPGILKRLVWLRAVKAYYNHPEAAIGYLDSSDERLKFYIRNHHNYEMAGDKKLRIIQEADSKN